MERFQGGLVFKAHRVLYRSTLGSRVIMKKVKEGAGTAEDADLGLENRDGHGITKLVGPNHPGGNPGANRWFLESAAIQMPPESGGICGRLTRDLPLGWLQGGRYRGGDRRGRECWSRSPRRTRWITKLNRKRISFLNFMAMKFTTPHDVYQ